MLLAIPLKTTRRYNIGPPLAHWVDKTHPYYRSDHMKNDLVRLTSLRNCLSESINTPHAHQAALADRALEDLEEYHACLLEAENRGFPTMDDALVGATELKLTWNCAFAEERPIVRSNLRYERACTLFDVAALVSYKAVTEDHRSSKEGRTRAMKLYGRAAATLRHLQTELMAGPSADHDPSADLTEPFLLMCESLLRAQGQICAYEAGRSRPEPMPALVAKLAAGAADLYDEALSHSQDRVVKAKVPEAASGWGGHLKAMSMLFRARSEVHASEAHRAGREWGAEVTRLAAAERMCGEAAKFQAGCESASGVVRIEEGGMGMLKNEIDWLRRTVGQRKEQAELDNRSIYHDRVPEEGDLESIKGQSMMSKLPPLDPGLEPSALKRPFFAGLPSVS